MGKQCIQCGIHAVAGNRNRWRGVGDGGEELDHEAGGRLNEREIRCLAGTVGCLRGEAVEILHVGVREHVVEAVCVGGGHRSVSCGG